MPRSQRPPLSLLNAHGMYHAQQFKRRIADFLGAPHGPRLKVVRAAAASLKIPGLPWHTEERGK